MPLIAFQTHVRVKCAVCHCDLIATWDSEYMTMGVTPCYDCMENAKGNAIEDMQRARAEFHRDELREEYGAPHDR